jgi:hypothetical protein
VKSTRRATFDVVKGQAFHPPGLVARMWSMRLASAVTASPGPAACATAFSLRERGFWLGGHWHHDTHFGRFGYSYVAGRSLA